MEDKRYRLPPVYAYLTFWLSVAAGVATFFWGEWALVCHLSRCVSRFYGNEPPHEHHRRPLLANARK